MNPSKNILHKSFAVLLIGLLWFPLVVQFAHIFEGHDHKPCGEITTHFHEKKVNCSLFDFHFSNYNYSVTSYPEFYSEELPTALETRYFSVEVSNTSVTYYVRGPPSIS